MLATRQAVNARGATKQDLLGLPVAALALAQTAIALADACSCWGQVAMDESDSSLGRALGEVARTLRVAAEHAHVASGKAGVYAESLGDGDTLEGDQALAS